MVEEKHVNEFIGTVTDKGYTDQFYAPGIDKGELQGVIREYIQKRPMDPHPIRTFPFWLGTELKQTSGDGPRTLCLMKVDYNVKNGFDIDTVKLAKWNRNNKDLGPYELMPIKSIHHLPHKDILLKNGLKKKKKLKL